MHTSRPLHERIGGSEFTPGIPTESSHALRGELDQKNQEIEVRDGVQLWLRVGRVRVGERDAYTHEGGAAHRPEMAMRECTE